MTAIAARPPAWETLEGALRDRCAVQLRYHGHQRIVCPHALGWKNGRAMLLAYQVGGHTTSGALSAEPRLRWRNLFIDDVHDVGLADGPVTWQSADNYNAARPFNAIDRLCVAVTSDALQATVR